jgi:hypothetical protein
MSESLLDRILSGEAFEGLPLKLHKEGKNVILCDDRIPNGGMYIIYPDKKACLLSYDNTLKKSIYGRELTQEEYNFIGIENYA